MGNPLPRALDGCPRNTFTRGHFLEHRFYSPLARGDPRPSPRLYSFMKSPFFQQPCGRGIFRIARVLLDRETRGARKKRQGRRSHCANHWDNETAAKPPRNRPERFSFGRNRLRMDWTHGFFMVIRFCGDHCLSKRWTLIRLGFLNVVSLRGTRD